MKRTWQSFAAGLAIVMVALAPACRSKKTATPVTHPDTMATTQTTAPPDLSATTSTTSTVKTDTSDFVVTETAPKVTESALPGDIEELNRYVEQRGLIADAFFGYDESALSADAQAALTTSATWLKQNTKYNVLIEGHCDERGTEQYNLALGDKRANIVKEYLATLGVDASRLRTVSYGEERPFDPGHDETAWAKNRRAHLVIVNR